MWRRWVPVLSLRRHKHIKAKGKEVFEALIQHYMYTWNSEYVLHYQSMKTICCHYVRQHMFYWCFFCYFKVHFHLLVSFKLIKTMVTSLNVYKVYLQCEIVIQRQVTKHGLPSVQLSRMMNLKIEFAKNKCLGTIWSTEMNPIAWTYPARMHFKNAYFLWLYNLTPTWFMTNFL